MPNDDKIRAIVRDEINKSKAQSTFSIQNVPLHTHSGNAGDAPKIPGANVIPGYRASGSITMATNNQTYRIGLNFQASRIDFYGVAFLTTGTPPNGPFTKRAMVTGNAQLGTTYILQDDGTGTSVTVGSQPQNIIQGCASFLVDETTLANAAAAVSEENLVYVLDNTASIVARAEVVAFGPDYADIEVELESDPVTGDWFIQGYFVVS